MRFIVLVWCVMMCAGPVMAADASTGAQAPAQNATDISVSAQVDRTIADVGDRVRLTLTLSGNLSNVRPPNVAFPMGIVVASESQSTNISIRFGSITKAVSFAYVLVATEPGEYSLGPFKIEKDQRTYTAEPITITIKRAVLPDEAEPSERLSI